MDAKGFEAINTALNGHANVQPVPEEGQDVRYVTVETAPDIAPAHVLNALGNAGLMEPQPVYTGVIKASPPKTLGLKVLGLAPGSITFEDVNAKPTRSY
jgi:hypothetical protein